jgi:hypothetical protein
LIWQAKAANADQAMKVNSEKTGMQFLAKKSRQTQINTCTGRAHCITQSNMMCRALFYLIPAAFALYAGTMHNRAITQLVKYRFFLIIGLNDCSN